MQSSSPIRILLFLLPILVASPLWAQDMVTVTDGDIPAGSTVVWTADKTYLLDGIVFVDSAATLTIEAGTVIKGAQGAGNNASALVVTRHAKIFAEGTPEAPIIFTAELDDLTGSLTFADRGEWGGVVILGQASTNNPTPGGLKEVEGVNEILPPGDTRAQYGGDDDGHSSGVFRYVSIRHTGINVGDQAGNEIQGLTLGGVGSGTVIEYVESFASGDDGFEFFGGTVNTKYLVSAFNEDDAFDYDEGFRGKGQFWFALQADDLAGRTAEQDGATGNEFFEPFAAPWIVNATYIGPGVGSFAAGDGEEMLIFRDNAGGHYRNSIFTDYETANGGVGITIEDIDNTGDKPQDSRARLEAGDLTLEHNLWWAFAGGNTLEAVAPQEFVRTYLAGAMNRVDDPGLRGVSRESDGGLDPRPTVGGPAYVDVWDVPEGEEFAFFEEVNYIGAFGQTNWLIGWTALDALGFVADPTTVDNEDGAADLPGRFQLAQNYPNPFNPSTSISFELARAQDVELTVFDLLGRQITRLAEGPRAAGVHTVTFDAAGLPSGMYVYRLEVDGRIESRKMMLLK